MGHACRATACPTYRLPALPALHCFQPEAQQSLGSLSEVEAYFQNWISALQAVGVPGEQLLAAHDLPGR